MVTGAKVSADLKTNAHEPILRKVNERTNHTKYINWSEQPRILVSLT